MDFLGGPWAILAVVLLPMVLIARSHLSSDKEIEKFHETSPFLGRKREWFSYLRASLRSFFDTPKHVADGYAKYGKAGQPFVVANIRKGPIMVIPPSQLKPVLSTPERIVDAHAPQAENISADYTMRDPNVFPSNYEVDIVRKQITKRYGSITTELAEEVQLAFDEIFGLSKEWKSVQIWSLLQDVVNRTFNRVVVGLPLCHDKHYLNHTLGHSKAILQDGVAIAFVPSFLKPVLGPLIHWKGTRHFEAFIRITQPLIEERLRDFNARVTGAHDGKDPPNDILQWLIEESASTGNPDQMSSRRIAHRLLLLNFNSVPPLSMTLSSTIFDLYSAPGAENYIEAIRKECDEVFDKGKEWSKDAVAQLHLLDSTIRESMRHSDFGYLAFPRRVNAPGGIEIGGVNVPKGVHMEIPMHNIHMDPDFYSEPTRFNPFRFAGPAAPDAESRALPQKPVVTLDDTFMTFGYGRNGCPGRFFGAHVMKVMFAHLVRNYDLEVLSERPKMLEIMEFRAPYESTVMRIRRRR